MRVKYISLVFAIFSSAAVAQSMYLDWFKSQEPDGKLPVLVDPSVQPYQPKWTDEVDFQSLRMSYAKRADFKTRCESRPNKEFFAATKQGQDAAAASVLEAWLLTCPVDAQAHLWATGAYAKAGDAEKQKLHARWFFGLTNAVLQSGGDGKTPQTAFEAISISEEKAVLVRLGLLKFISQNLTSSPPYVDQLVGENQAGVKFTINFNPRWQFIRQAYEFGIAK